MLINYGYFRHRFDAHTDPKLNELADDMGVIIYGYYYTLIELYGAKYADKNEDGFVDIHIRTIANTWRKRVDSCDLVLTKLQLSGMLVFTKCKNTYSLSIPNFPKYYGSYKKRDTPTPSNKRKEKKIKEKKSKVTPLPPSGESVWGDKISEVIKYLNEKSGKNYRTDDHTTVRVILSLLKANYSVSDFKTVIDNKCTDWLGTEREQYIRPKTIFGDNFESYLNQVKQMSGDELWE
jgi:uncharacterized phage protein (TIGR02220 family)